MLRRTPSVYVTKQGGGFGDSRINVRGFDQRNVAVMINGIPVNDMENGWVYWSNWAGLADVTSNIQVQRGLGASKLAVASVGGSINIVTNAADLEKGGAFSANFGNDGYMKYALSYSTGLGEKGWAWSFQGTHTRGNGYVQGTQFQAYSYFAAVTKQFNRDNMLSFTVVGAPQWHHQRLIPGQFDNIGIRSFVDPGDNPTEEQLDDMPVGLGRKWNWTHGDLDGKEFNWRRNFYHKPKMFLNHYWTISPKTDLKTSAYASFGRGGGTGPRGRIRSPGSVFDSFSGLGQGTHDENGHVRFNDLNSYHQGSKDFTEEWGAKEVSTAGDEFNGQFVSTNNGEFPLSTVGREKEEGTGFVRRASMNSHNWYGILSTLTTKLNDRLNLIAGFDGRYYKGIHYRRLENKLGNDVYYSQSDVNGARYITDESPANFGNFSDNSYKDKTNVLAYWNDGLVRWFGLFGQLEYSVNNVSAFVSLSGSNQGFKRIDYFNYEDDDPARETDWQSFWGGTVKGGVNYNINEKHNVFVNGGFYSRQPIFDNVFLNFQNDVNEDVKNQNVTAFEAGYGFRTGEFRGKANFYYTLWGNRQFDETQDNDLGEEVLYNFEGVEQQHIGIELEAHYNPIRALGFYGMFSWGDWKYTSNFTATGFNLDTQEPEGEETLYMEGLEVGDAAQMTFTLGVNWEILDGLSLWADYMFADRLFAQYEVNDEFLEPGGKIVSIPSYGLMDMGVSYTFPVGKTRLRIHGTMNNVLDTEYISELVTNIEDNPDTPNFNEYHNNRGVYGFGRTWNAGVKLFF